LPCVSAPLKNNCSNNDPFSDSCQGAAGRHQAYDEQVSPQGIEHARSKANDDRPYLDRKPSYTREQFAKVRDMLGQAAVGIAAIAQEVGLSRQTVYRI
jgi:helix-turn-helix resolvase-like protein